MLTEADVNEALLRHAADELEIAVPIRAWEVRDDQLVLLLAYGGEARWGPGRASGDAREGAPALATLTKRELQAQARAQGLKGYSRLTKAELVALLDG